MALYDKISGEPERSKCRTKETERESVIFTRAKSQSEVMVKASFIEAEERAKSAWPFSKGEF